MKPFLRITTLALILLSSTFVYAHSGRTDSKGCHTNKATGEYHCHTKTETAPPPAPATTETAPVQTAPTAEQIATAPAQANILKLEYEGFTVWLDCSKRGAVKFMYHAQHDTGNAPRLNDFYLDSKVPSECQQTTAKAYGKGYDRGHLVPANHLDNSETAIKATNIMMNILPQVANMNRGAWLQTEEIVECYRDIDELLVIGGVVWGDYPSDDYFVTSHGVKTPDAYWKVIIRGSGQSEKVIAWIVPNTKDAKRANLDSYLVTIDQIEKMTGEKLPVADYSRHEKPPSSWLIPKGCNKG